MRSTYLLNTPSTALTNGAEYFCGLREISRFILTNMVWNKVSES